MRNAMNLQAPPPLPSRKAGGEAVDVSVHRAMADNV